MDFFIIHLISSLVSAILIITLSLQCFLKKMKHHKIISFIMGIFGIISLSSSYNMF
jgi:hypothetical protein